MNNVKTVVAFIFGAGIGSVAAWYFLKQRNEEILNEEKESYKEYYEKKLAEMEPEVESEPSLEELRNKKDISEYIKDKQVTNYAKVEPIAEETEPEHKRMDQYEEEPYVVSPSEFGEDHEYNTISLLYFADGILTDDDYSIIENVDEIVGEESLRTFGQYEDDAVYVRNERLKCEYEILYDSRNFYDIDLAKLRNGLD